MPSTLDLPTIADLQKAFRDGARAKERRSDIHDGSKLDNWGGLGAIFWSKEAQRDRDLFRKVYDGTADSDDLTTRLNARYGIPRILDSYGLGTATLVRPNASAGAGTIWNGTRLFVLGLTGQAAAQIYAVAADTPVTASQTSVQNVPVRATVLGYGTAIDTSASGLAVRIDDPLWDNSFTVARMNCADGASFEPAAQYLARVYQTRLNARVGYRRAILDACIAAGASHVAMFASNYGGDANDHGINAIYVGDQSYTGSTTLVQQCLIALEQWRVLGADLQVLPMVSGRLTISANVYLWTNPSRVDTADLTQGMTAQAQQYFAPESGGFAYRLDALGGQMSKVSNQVQSIVFTTPSADLSVLVGSPPNFPNTLTKWRLATNDVQLTFLPPQ